MGRGVCCGPTRFECRLPGFTQGCATKTTNLPFLHVLAEKVGFDVYEALRVPEKVVLYVRPTIYPIISDHKTH